MRGREVFRLCCIGAMALWSMNARAEEAGAKDMDETATNIFEQETLTGHSFGYRKDLEDVGVDLGADEIFDALANPIGGRKQGAAFEGRFEIFANINLATLWGWSGTIFHVNAYQIHGHGLSADDVGNLLTVSNIGADPSTRLFGLWLQKSFYDDTLSIRAGQIAADDEFFISQYASLFINSAFGWPSVLGINLPSGGPAYPLATPGVRVKLALSPQWVVTSAVFNGDPAPAGSGDPQMRDGGGTSFRMNGDVFWVSELAYSPGGGTAPLPGTFKLGGWVHSGLFADQRYDAMGRSLAVAGSGVAALHRGDFGGYFIADQMLWREDVAGSQGLGAFFRIGGAPGDRNLIEFHVDTGLSYTGLIDGRDNDVLGLGISYDQVSDARRALTDDLRGVTGLGLPASDFESAIELSYQTQVAPWWIVQPDVQVILHPGANLGATVPAKTATVMGVRTAISF